MPLTTLDRSPTAFRRCGLPVVLVNVTGRAPGRTDNDGRRPGDTTPRSADWADIIDELGPQPGDHRITKRRRSAFHDTGLDTLLRDLGVTQVILAGVSTSSGVESTARSAHDHGYHVVLATDAMTDPDPGSHRHSLERVFPKLGQSADVSTDRRSRMHANPLGVALRNRRAGQHTLVCLPAVRGRPGSRRGGRLHLEQALTAIAGHVIGRARRDGTYEIR